MSEHNHSATGQIESLRTPSNQEILDEMEATISHGKTRLSREAIELLHDAIHVQQTRCDLGL